MPSHTWVLHLHAKSYVGFALTCQVIRGFCTYMPSYVWVFGAYISAKKFHHIKKSPAAVSQQVMK